MPEKQSTRRKFLQILGLTAGTALVSTSSLASFLKPEDIRKLTPEQHEFMVRYSRWMDEFIVVVRIQKTEPNNIENQQEMIALTERADAFKPELADFMKDESFVLIYQASIQKLSTEI